MKNKDHAQAILSKLLFRPSAKIEGEYDYLTDTEICEKIIEDYLNEKYPPAFSNVMRSFTMDDMKSAWDGGVWNGMTNTNDNGYYIGKDEDFDVWLKENFA